MRFLAHEQQGNRAVTPQAELERHPAKYGDNRIDDLGGKTCQLHDCHWPTVRGQPEQLADYLSHGVAAHIRVREHKAVAGIVAHRLDARNQFVEFHPR
jgi:hypothetical protein